MTQLPKFRAWHKEYKTMLKVIQLEWLGNEHEELFKVTTHYDGDTIFGTSYNPSQIILMQCSGIQDIHGKDIYVGDIVKLQGQYFPIVFRCASFSIETRPYQNVVQDMMLYQFTDAEVVGNVYEHSELLEAK